MAQRRKIIREVINSGLIHEEPQSTDYHSHHFTKGGEPMMGAISPLEKPPVLFKNGIGWKKLARKYGNPELQKNKKFDTFSCVIFAIAKNLCYYIFKRYGIKITVSEMYNAFWAQVTHGKGTTIRLGMESFRKKGWVADKDYPFTPGMALAEFFRRPPKTIQVMAEGKLLEWDFHWEVLPRNLKAIFNQYKRTPVVLTGFAWASYYGDAGIYFDYNNPANHAFLGLEPTTDGNNFCDDTYIKTFKYKEDAEKDELFKTLDKSFAYGSAHYCWVTPTKDNNKLTIKKIINMFQKIARAKDGGFWFIKKNKEGVEHKQEINNWKAMLGAIIDEIGVNKNDLTKDELTTIPNFKFFGE